MAVICAGLLAGCARHRVRDADAPLFVATQPREIEASPVAHSPYAAVPASADVKPTAPETAPTPAVKVDHYGPSAPVSYPSVVESPPAPPPAPKPPDDPPLVAALRCLLDQRPADAVASLKGCDPSNQEAVLNLLPLVMRLAEPGKDKPLSKTEATVAVEQLNQIEEGLRLKANLVLDKMCYCNSIERFGVYEARPEGSRFVPGSPVHIYVELRNFTSQPHNCCFETRLASTIKLLDGQGRAVHQLGFNDRSRPECSRSARHDYFINYSFRVPENFEPGKYELKLRVEDVPTGRAAEQTLELIVGPKLVATGG